MHINTFIKNLSLRELGLSVKEDSAFKAMITIGNMDFNFKPYSTEDLKSVKKSYDFRKNKANALLCIAFGNLGLGNKGIATENFKKALLLDPYNPDVKDFCNN